VLRFVAVGVVHQVEETIMLKRFAGYAVAVLFASTLLTNMGGALAADAPAIPHKQAADAPIKRDAKPVLRERQCNVAECASSCKKDV
jgi:hypothetical protein